MANPYLFNLLESLIRTLSGYQPLSKVQIFLKRPQRRHIRSYATLMKHSYLKNHINLLYL
jgi:hypothetical protein